MTVREDTVQSQETAALKRQEIHLRSFRKLVHWTAQTSSFLNCKTPHYTTVKMTTLSQDWGQTEHMAGECAVRHTGGLFI